MKGTEELLHIKPRTIAFHKNRIKATVRIEERLRID